eukprot:gnl/TRDRNA2_/TRDRNA2_158481_c0_seq1.p1 gnl/TRDRNA2_/TRDRNA2_158481_c0~~gnl/TRDRNA2_/TRDRNA2_158481_c0_seq1.p1  ORF type:complete len:589 (+),score=62.06 gnl/TRDRNA2_/TRDRNA2_158481_c0_seq1:342-2108(+)
MTHHREAVHNRWSVGPAQSCVWASQRPEPRNSTSAKCLHAGSLVPWLRELLQRPQAKKADGHEYTVFSDPGDMAMPAAPQISAAEPVLADAADLEVALGLSSENDVAAVGLSDESPDSAGLKISLRDLTGVNVADAADMAKAKLISDVQLTPERGQTAHHGHSDIHSSPHGEISRLEGQLQRLELDLTAANQNIQKESDDITPEARTPEKPFSVWRSLPLEEEKEPLSMLSERTIDIHRTPAESSEHLPRLGIDSEDKSGKRSSPSRRSSSQERRSSSQEKDTIVQLRLQVRLQGERIARLEEQVAASGGKGSTSAAEAMHSGADSILLSASKTPPHPAMIRTASPTSVVVQRKVSPERVRVSSSPTRLGFRVHAPPNLDSSQRCLSATSRAMSVPPSLFPSATPVRPTSPGQPRQAADGNGLASTSSLPNSRFVAVKTSAASLPAAPYVPRQYSGCISGEAPVMSTSVTRQHSATSGVWPGARLDLAWRPGTPPVVKPPVPGASTPTIPLNLAFSPERSGDANVGSQGHLQPPTTAPASALVSRTPMTPRTMQAASMRSSSFDCLGRSGAATSPRVLAMQVSVRGRR